MVWRQLRWREQRQVGAEGACWSTDTRAKLGAHARFRQPLTGWVVVSTAGAVQAWDGDDEGKGNGLSASCGGQNRARRMW